jgi:hypothetical protein
MDYNKTFESRCEAFKYAMETYPHVMAHELRTAIEMCDIQSNDTLLNIPAACIPLSNFFIQKPKAYIEYETNKKFGDLMRIPHAEFYDIPERPTSVSKIISLASLHHATQEERRAFYVEARRILDPSGALIIGDVLADSPQARWLNIFVDAHNPAGHKGIFWSENDSALLEETGFAVQVVKKQYTWDFKSRQEMIDFCHNLFGLTNATDETIESGIQTHLSPVFNDDGSIQIPWQLIYFHCRPY